MQLCWRKSEREKERERFKYIYLYLIVKNTLENIIFEKNRSLIQLQYLEIMLLRLKCKRLLFYLFIYLYLLSNISILRRVEEEKEKYVIVNWVIYKGISQARKS